MMHLQPSDCPHDDVAETITWGEAARGIERGICVDCGTHLARKPDGDWQPAA